MPTLDDAPERFFTEPENVEAASVWGQYVDKLLTDAANSDVKYTQRLGVKASDALDTLARAVRKEARLAELAAEIARVRKGES